MFREKLLLIVRFAVLILAVFNSLRWVIPSIQGRYQPLDFNTYFLAAKTFDEGLNFYSESDRVINLNNSDSTTWINIRHVSINETPVYAPQFTLLFELFIKLGYGPSKSLYFFLTISGLLLSVFWASKLSGGLDFKWALAGVLAFRGTWYALDNGQPLLLCLPVILAAIHYGKNPRYALFSGIMLGIFAFKFTLIFAPLAYWFLQKNFKGIIACVTVSLLLNSLALAINPTDTTILLQAWSNNMSSIWNFIHQEHFLNSLNIINCSASVILAYYGLVPVQILKIIFSLLFIVVFVLVFILAYKRQDKSASVLLGLTLISQCFAQHLIYDLLVMVVYAIVLYKKDYELKWWMFPNLFILILPLGKLSDITGIQETPFLVPIVLLMNLFIWMYCYLSNKNSAIKKPS